ncbi:MAG: hypothetical protein JRI65_14345 [Deltaproteobacteria bacterium]|nr:hypothetical protein [Deltaproteobacteria bacterium]
MNQGACLDLVILVPGKDERETFDALLSSRRESIGIRKINYEILVHPRRDPGCFHEAHDVLQPYIALARYALVVFDHEGSGREEDSPQDLTENLRKRLAASGWEDRVEVLLLEPELENWVWSDSPHVDEVTGWQGQNPPLREWIRGKGWWPSTAAKPERPKEVFEEALRQVKMRRSSAIYRQLAERVSLERCSDGGFLYFKALMQHWFSREGSE